MSDNIPPKEAMETDTSSGAAASGPRSYPIESDPEKRIHEMSRRSFLWGAVGVAATFGGWYWLGSRELNNGIPWPLRRMLGLNEKLAETYFRDYRLAPEFAASQITLDPNPDLAPSQVRVNGEEGLSDDIDLASWRLRVKGLHDLSHAVTTDEDKEPALELTLADIKALPKITMVTELKCIEGWSIVVQWTGARFADFAAKYGPATQSGKAPDIVHNPEDILPYVGMETPDGGYYVGLDRESALHPQTLLCYEMNGKPLTPNHGAPLRLAIPVKYGVKNIKCIGTIRFTVQRPKDYWAERGYDWYAGH